MKWLLWHTLSHVCYNRMYYMGHSCLKKQRYAYLLAAALTVILTVEAFAAEGEEEQGPFYATLFSLLPPVAAIVLAFVTMFATLLVIRGITRRKEE